MERDPKQPVPRPSIEQPREDVERESSPGNGEREHHGITGPRTAESEESPTGPPSEREPDTGERLF